MSQVSIYMSCCLWKQICSSKDCYKKMAHKQQDVHLAKTCPQRHENQATCLLTCPSNGKAIFTSYPIQAHVILKKLVRIIYQNYATQLQGAHDISKQALLNILKCSDPYTGCFHNKNVFIAYQRKVQSHSQGTYYKPYTSLRYKSIFHSKIQNIHPNIIYVRFVYKCKLCQLTMIVQTQSGTNTTK